MTTVGHKISTHAVTRPSYLSHLNPINTDTSPRKNRLERGEKNKEGEENKEWGREGVRGEKNKERVRERERK